MSTLHRWLLGLDWCDSPFSDNKDSLLLVMGEDVEEILEETKQLSAKAILVLDQSISLSKTYADGSFQLGAP